MVNWRLNLAGDSLALGSWIFFILVVGRALIEPYREFADPTIIAGIILVIASVLFSHDGYVARMLVLTVFAIFFYENTGFTIFAIAASIGVIISSYYVGTPPRQITLGLLIGAIAITIGYFGAQLTLVLI